MVYAGQTDFWRISRLVVAAAFMAACGSASDGQAGKEPPSSSPTSSAGAAFGSGASAPGIDRSSANGAGGPGIDRSGASGARATLTSFECGGSCALQTRGGGDGETSSAAPGGGTAGALTEGGSVILGTSSKAGASGNPSGGTTSGLLGASGGSLPIGTGGARAGSPSTSSGSCPSCDDRNDCTLDRVNEYCECTHQITSDGTGCDDGDVCTSGDSCQQGNCRGTAIQSTSAVVGQLKSYGYAPGLQTLVAFPNEQRAVFAQGRRLTLVGLDDDRATVLHDIAMGPTVTADAIGAMVWANRPRTFLIPMLEHHLAIASVDRGIDLFDLAGDKLTPTERYGFGAGLWQIKAATGRGQRLYACTAHELEAWSVDPTTNSISRGVKLALPARHACLGLSLSPDGTSLYVATDGGLVRVAISGADGTMAVATSIREGNLVADVDATKNYVAVFEIRELTSGQGDVVVLSAESLEVVATIGADLGPGGISPTGFALLESDRLLIQLSSADPNTDEYRSNALTLQLHPDASPTELHRIVTFDANQSPYRTPSFHTVARGPRAVLEPMHQLVRIEPSNGVMTLLPAESQGSFERVRAGDAHTVYAYGPGSVHRVDISDPTAPSVVWGGPTSPVTMEWLRLDITNPTASTLLSVDGNDGKRFKTPITSVMRVGIDGVAGVFGSIANDLDSATWYAAGSNLYELSPIGGVDFRLRGFAASSIESASGQRLTASLDEQLATGVDSTLDSRGTSLLAVDASTGDVAIVEHRSSTADRRSEANLSVFHPKDDGFERRFSKSLGQGSATRVAIADGRIAAVVSHGLVVSDRDGNTRAVTFSEGNYFEIQDVIHMDQRVLVLAVTWGAPISSAGVLILRSDDLSEVARYATSESVKSYAEVGNHLVFGMPSTLAIATLACSSI